MKKVHLNLIAAFVILFVAVQVSANPSGIETEPIDQGNNVEVEMTDVNPEEAITDDSSAEENLVLNVEEVQKGQSLAIESTEDVGEYGDDYSLYLLLCLLLGIPVIIVL